MGSITSTSAPWPIQAQLDVTLHSADLLRAECLAQNVLDDEPALSGDGFFGGQVKAGWQAGPTLFYEDHRSIEMVSDTMARRFEYRVSALAGDDDIVLLSRTRDPVFEAYLDETLCLGSADVRRVVISVQHRHQRLDAVARGDKPFMQYLTKRAKTAGCLNVLPFLATGDTWRLASDVAQSANVDVYVCAPSPRLSRRANDKLWFADRVRELLGNDAVAPTWRAYGLVAAVSRLRYLARRNERVVLKSTASAGSMGNIVLESADVLAGSLTQCSHRIHSALSSLGERTTYPLLVGVWEHPVISSPSLHCWIPAAGEPVIDGVFEQCLSGTLGVFVGAQPAHLPAQLAARFTHQGMLLARLLQALGYVGRVSMDALIVGHDGHDSCLHWIECNARWGGVSIPMILTQRLKAGASLARPLVPFITQVTPLRKGVPSFEQLVTIAHNLGMHHGWCDRGIIWLSPPLDTGSLLAFVCVATSITDAKHSAKTLIEAITTQL